MLKADNFRRGRSPEYFSAETHVCFTYQQANTLAPSNRSKQSERDSGCSSVEHYRGWECETWLFQSDTLNVRGQGSQSTQDAAISLLSITAYVTAKHNEKIWLSYQTGRRLQTQNRINQELCFLNSWRWIILKVCPFYPGRVWLCIVFKWPHNMSCV